LDDADDVMVDRAELTVEETDELLPKDDVLLVGAVEVEREDIVAVEELDKLIMADKDEIDDELEAVELAADEID
jgi:hypothetical protein